MNPNVRIFENLETTLRLRSMKYSLLSYAPILRGFYGGKAECQEKARHYHTRAIIARTVAEQYRVNANTQIEE